MLPHISHTWKCRFNAVLFLFSERTCSLLCADILITWWLPDGLPDFSPAAAQLHVLTSSSQSLPRPASLRSCVVTHLSRSCACFFTVLSFFLLSCRGSLYILDPRPVLDICFANHTCRYFLPFCGSSVHFLDSAPSYLLFFSCYLYF